MNQAGGAAVALTGIAKRYGRRWPLRGLSLTVAPGEVLALLGRNGSGKTTLLRVLATLTRATRGTGTVFGASLENDADAVRALVGMLGHAAGLYGDLTATENLAFAARMRGVRPADAGIHRLLEAVDLTEHADERVRGFSAGMQRRLAVARLLLRPPRLLLLDEPHAAFDADGIALVHRLALQVRDAGGAVLVATHHPRHAAAIVDRAVLLEAGRLSDVPRDTLAGLDPIEVAAG